MEIEWILISCQSAQAFKMLNHSKHYMYVYVISSVNQTGNHWLE